MNRKPLSQRDWIEMLLNQGAVIPCGCCKQPITDPDNIRREHLNELYISRDDSVGNQQLWHRVPCSHTKTYGTKVTTLGSSAHIVAKAKRMAKGPKPPSRLAEKYAWAKRIKQEL